MKEHTFTIIIPAAGGEEAGLTLDAVRRLDYPKKKIEVILVRGNQPSRQRNLAAARAAHEILYFLDSDALPDRNNLKILNRLFSRHKDAVLAGGPSLSRETDTLFQKAIGCVFASFAGSAFSRARYARIGKPRISSELELILCNMAVRKDVFRRFSGFDPRLYPNEENEFINRLTRAGEKVYYSPDLAVFRSHRPTLLKFIRQVLTYGRGRSEQVLISFRSITLFPVLSLFIGFYLFLAVLVPRGFIPVPLFIYLAGILGLSVFKAVSGKKPLMLLYLPLLFFLTHTLYGAGFLWGFLKRPWKEKIKREKFRYGMKWIKKT